MGKMIYSKLLESNSPLQLAAMLETFFGHYNTQPNEEKKILYILQSETSSAYSGTDRGFETTKKSWHGTITIVYEVKKKIEYN